jgi:N6-L-threonylcarbamoyladenine synthase
VPELASRMHQESIIPLLKEVLSKAGITKPSKEIDLIAVTAGPGLMGSLLVGVMTAKALSQGWNVPIVAVNHLEGHLFANVVTNKDLKPPFLSVIVSGGHTEIILVREFGSYILLGSTRDDAAGEAYDKISKVLGLGYPGGPAIDELAKTGDPDRYKLPMPLSDTQDVEFSFSGLKTATITLIHKLEKTEGKIDTNDLCASFQKAVVGSIIGKLLLAINKTGVHKVAISGGVAANSRLREDLQNLFEKNNWELYLPPKMVCTDNAIMIAAAGYNMFDRGIKSDLSFSPNPSWTIW